MFGGRLLAQDIEATGAVLEWGTKNRIGGVEVTNKRSRIVVSTSTLGLFSIRAVIGDTLIFSGRNYNEQRLAVTSAAPLVVKMLPMVNVLEDVTITGFNRKTGLDEARRDFKRNGSFYEGKPPFLSFLFTPLTAIYEIFGRTPRNARRFGKYYASESQNILVDQLFNSRLVAQHTPLRGKELQSFVFNFRPDYETVKKWNSYDAIKYVKESYKRYQENPDEVLSIDSINAILRSGGKQE
ncbi:hypothetical protein C7T94_01965 [Pedobacter yulinensis]|uniref:Uncharacterized protein n=2 Tax=Pedobacter yulinensis TaxID=2126353 RepID=A0A2T3HR86_9SPHI|nr:hypothetical protein C7T94_01965 [Pedobacter yulinensis]